MACRDIEGDSSVRKASAVVRRARMDRSVAFEVGKGHNELRTAETDRQLPDNTQQADMARSKLGFADSTADRWFGSAV